MTAYSVRAECVWVVKLAAALLAGALLLSPGAATSALLMYREAQLEDGRTGSIVLMHDDDGEGQLKATDY
ncbi:hypothetical protein EW145_g8566 [Phellinidium pouzarii]|uniref:Uncharacterized protein n=1 Tax=Phellinidium pouzarii TaxID=167371 RepID=A0A4V3X953_9AGAM|nr:hypothetical protein EW145_g8566 [Phellinidium pouzarii]